MKYQTTITKANGGLHSLRAYKSALRMIDECIEAYSSSRLYHLVFSNAENPAHKALLKDLMQHLKRNNIRASYRAAREVDQTKGEHLHIFICAEARINNPCNILNRKPRSWLVQYAMKRGIKVQLNPPRSSIHSGHNYISLPKSKPEKIADAKVWISYLYKVRSKPESGEIYSSSRNIQPTTEQPKESHHEIELNPRHKNQSTQGKEDQTVPSDFLPFTVSNLPCQFQYEHSKMDLQPLPF